MSSLPQQADGLLTHTLLTSLHLVSAAVTSVLAFFPPAVSNVANSVLASAQQLLAENWEARVAALCLMLPSLAVLAVFLSIAVAILWPFTFLLGTVGGLCVTAVYLFWPSSSDLKTCLVSAAFALASQLLLVLPVYFLSPAALFVLLLATSAYLFMSGSYLLLLATGWWLVTTPYWSLIHFVTFPFLFTASILLQVACTIGALTATTLYPELPSLIQRHYAAFVQQRRLSLHSASNGHTAQHTAGGEWVKTEYGTSKRRDEHVREESKSHE